jgi:hypothetical protein
VRLFGRFNLRESAFPFRDPVLKGAPSGDFRYPRTREEQHLAKPKTKAAVKKKPAKTQARAAAPAKAPKKAAAAKSAAKPVKASPAKAAKAPAVKAVAAKAMAGKTPVVVAPEVKPVATPRAQEKAEVLTLPAARQAETVAPKPAPAPVVRKAVDPSTATRADLPPPDGFTLLVDGHFKNQFGDLKGAKTAASELKSRFPMLRIEIYDAAKKERLPA